MGKFEKKVLFADMERTKRKFINGVRHKLQFGGLGSGEFETAKWLIRTAQIGHRYVSDQYKHLIPLKEGEAQT